MAKKIKPLYKGRRLTLDRDLKLTIELPKVVCDQKKIIKEYITYHPSSRTITVSGQLAIAHLIMDTYEGDTRVWYQNDAAKRVSTIPYDYFVTHTTVNNTTFTYNFSNSAYYQFYFSLAPIIKNLISNDVSIFNPYKIYANVVNNNNNNNNNNGLAIVSKKRVHRYSDIEYSEDNGNINIGQNRENTPVIGSRSYRMVVDDQRNDVYGYGNNDSTPDYIWMDANRQGFLMSDIRKRTWSPVVFYQYTYTASLNDDVDEDELIDLLFSSNSNININTTYDELTDKHKSLFNLTTIEDYNREKYQLKPVSLDSEFITYLRLVNKENNYDNFDPRRIAAENNNDLVFLFDKTKINSYYANINALKNADIKNKVIKRLIDFSRLIKATSNTNDNSVRYNYSMIGFSGGGSYGFTVSDSILVDDIATLLILSGQYQRYGTVIDKYLENQTSEINLKDKTLVKQDSIRLPKTLTRDEVNNYLTNIATQYNLFNMAYSIRVYDDWNSAVAHNDNYVKAFYNELVMTDNEINALPANSAVGVIEFGYNGQRVVKTINKYMSTNYRDNYTLLDPYEDSTHFIPRGTQNKLQMLTVDELVNWKGGFFISFKIKVNNEDYIVPLNMGSDLTRFIKENHDVKENKSINTIGVELTDNDNTLTINLENRVTKTYNYRKYIDGDDYRFGISGPVKDNLTEYTKEETVTTRSITINNHSIQPDIYLDGLTTTTDKARYDLYNPDGSNFKIIIAIRHIDPINPDINQITYDARVVKTHTSWSGGIQSTIEHDVIGGYLTDKMTAGPHDPYTEFKYYLKRNNKITSVTGSIDEQVFEPDDIFIIVQNDPFGGLYFIF